MADLQRQIAEIELHPQAVKTVEDYVAHYTNSLVLQSKTLAVIDGMDQVQSVNVKDARALVVSNEQKRGRTRELWIIVGSALVGAFLQGFVTELSADPIRKLWVAVYVIMGLAGMLAVFSALRK
jgi:hypothetical protein